MEDNEDDLPEWLLDDASKDFETSETKRFLCAHLKEEALSVFLSSFYYLGQGDGMEEYFKNVSVTMETDDDNEIHLGLVSNCRDHLLPHPSKRAFMFLLFHKEIPEGEGQRKKPLPSKEPPEFLGYHAQLYPPVSSLLMRAAIGALNCIVDTGYELKNIYIDSNNKKSKDDPTGIIKFSFVSILAHYQAVDFIYNQQVLVDDEVYEQMQLNRLS